MCWKDGKIVADLLDDSCQGAQSAITKARERLAFNLPDQFGLQKRDNPGRILLADKRR
jgi:hypothetical protein